MLPGKQEVEAKGKQVEDRMKENTTSVDFCLLKVWGPD